MSAEICTSIATWATAIATAVMAGVSYCQLSKLNKSLSDSNLMANFEIEFELNRRKERLADLRKENQDFVNGRDKTGDMSEAEKAILKRMDGRYQEALENYLNIFDRLCYFIRHHKLNEEDFRIDYREILQKAIAEYEKEFKNGTKYHNMLELNKIWAEK